MKDLTLHELTAAEDNRVFSPYVWRVRLVLALKGIPFTSAPWRFEENDKIAPRKLVPVLDYVEGDAHKQRMGESLDIARLIEKEHPEPAVFGTACGAGDAGVDFIAAWADTKLLMAIFRFCVLDMYNSLAEKNKPYIRREREKLFGQTLEEVVGDQQDKVQAIRELVEPVRAALKSHKWLGGSKPNWADIVVFSHFLWAKAISPVHLLEKGDPVYQWREEMAKYFSSAFEGTLSHPF